MINILKGFDIAMSILRYIASLHQSLLCGHSTCRSDERAAVVSWGCLKRYMGQCALCLAPFAKGRRNMSIHVAQVQDGCTSLHYFSYDKTIRGAQSRQAVSRTACTIARLAGEAGERLRC